MYFPEHFCRRNRHLLKRKGYVRRDVASVCSEGGGGCFSTNAAINLGAKKEMRSGYYCECPSRSRKRGLRNLDLRLKENLPPCVAFSGVTDAAYFLTHPDDE